MLALSRRSLVGCQLQSEGDSFVAWPEIHSARTHWIYVMN